MKYALLLLVALAPFAVRGEGVVTCRAPVGHALEVLRAAENREQAITRRVPPAAPPRAAPAPLSGVRVKPNQNDIVTRPVSNDHVVSQVAVTRRVPPPLPKKAEPVLELTDHDIITVVAPPSHVTLSAAEVFDPRNSPYRATAEPTKSGASGQYHFTLPKRDQLKILEKPLSSALLPAELRLGPGSVAVRLASELRRSGLESETNATFAGEGSSYVAHFVHGPAPAAGPARVSWAARAANYVLKVLKPDALGDAYAVLKRTLLERELFETLSRRSRFGEDRLVRPVRIFSTPAEHAAGFLRVEALRGPRLDKVQEAVLVFRNPSRKSTMTYSEARTLLTEHFPNWEEDPSASLAESVEEAQQRIDAICKFYEDTHNLAILAQKKNGLMQLANKMPDGSVRFMGFDFALGENVFWNHEERIWVSGE